MSIFVTGILSTTYGSQSGRWKRNIGVREYWRYAQSGARGVTTSNNAGDKGDSKSGKNVNQVSAAGRGG